jgi:beta-glucosidase-like glycosyl hydrolase
MPISTLLTEVLKNELGFEGFLVSDWEAINQIGPNFYESVVTAINAGIDMNMVPYNYKLFIDAMTMAVENGDIQRNASMTLSGEFLPSSLNWAYLNDLFPTLIC